MFTWVQGVLLLFQSISSFIVGYLLILTGAAQFAKGRTTVQSREPVHRFLVLIPAHNEEKLLPNTLKNLKQLDYPESLYSIHVIADNCTDNTSDVARSGGATVHERKNDALLGKGYALQWALERLWAADEPHDAVLILDADSTISPNFLSVMDARLGQGERVIQAYYTVGNMGQSRGVDIRYAALAAVHFLRPQGRMALGGSAGLKGNGMVFAADILKQHKWSESLTEDIELHMSLILNGERVTFAPDAVVQAEMPESLAGSYTQNVRWERGRMQALRHYTPLLLKRAWSSRSESGNRRSFLFFDAAMEHIIPPFSLFAAWTALTLLAVIGLPGGKSNIGGRNQEPVRPMNSEKKPHRLKSVNVLLGGGLLLGQLIYMFGALRAVQAPRRIYQSLAYTPIFVVWKIWLYIRVLLGLDKQGWVRTKRND
ncbi:MAG: glycosyltransferase family 2 protein [Candidatus Promineifilaceae bacterium]|jgi:1,2-diacylglycerol 3-beta-glucosyltransferase